MSIKKSFKKIAAISMLAGTAASANTEAGLSISAMIDTLATVGGLAGLCEIGFQLLKGKSGVKVLLDHFHYNDGLLNGKKENAAPTPQ